MRIATTLPLSVATAITDKALALAREAEMLPMTVVVLDAGGKMISMRSEDGSGLIRFNVAFGKAYGALGMGMSSRLIRDRLASRPVFQGAIASASDGRFIPVPGGVLVENAEGVTLGAVGISGDASEKDEYCAVEAIKAAGYQPEPAEPDPDWRLASLSGQPPAQS